MRLHHLTVTAFGPFAGTERVDFDALGAAGLFLFTGATGAGKTSILDAVCFALYGQVPGARQGGRSLRSDHAQPGVAPGVVLEATIRGRRLLITRSPGWERPKKRGGGTVLAQPSVVVQEVGADGQWVTRSTRLDEAGQLLGGLLGLTMAQFCQVVLLPQGQFADFLRADADRRRQLLETLFDTRRFSAVETWLVARRQDTARRLAEVDDELHRLVARVAEAIGAEAGPDGLDEPAEGSRLAEVGGWVEGLLRQAETGRALAEHAAAASLAPWRQATAALEEGRRIAELRRRAHDLRARKAALEARSAEHAALVAALSAARSVGPILPLLAQVDEASTALAEVQAQLARQGTVLTRTQAATGTDGPPWSGGDLSVQQLADLARLARDEVAALRVTANHETQVRAIELEQDTLSRRVVELESERGDVQAWLAKANAREEELIAAREVARSARQRLPDLQATVDAAAARLAAAHHRDDLLAQCTAAADALRRSIDAFQVARTRELDLRARRLRGMAGELAASLRKGAGCPVCGSSDHPSPAQPTDVVTADEERAAADVTAETERARRAAEDRVALLRLEVTAARTLAGGDVEAATLAEAAASARDAHGRAQARAETLGTAEGALDQFRRERERQVQAQVSVDAQISSTAAKVADLRDRAALLLAEIATARGTDPTVAARVSRLERAATDLEALAVTLSDADRLRRGLADLVARVDNELLRLELPSVAAVRAAARTGEQITELEARCARHESELRAVLDQLADPAVREAAEAAEPDLVALAAQAQTAQERHLEAATRAESAAAKVLALQRLHGCALDWLTRRDPLAAAHSLADRLARLAEGKSTDNHLRMSLSAYVLAARLEQVAACASERLLRMSSGRYSLVHSADPTGGRSGNARSRGGLTLRVLDAWTGQERDPVTLSGGETFFVSLALALGLAEVVSSEAGGAVLETLFVDEGFGSLDDDTLDEVMGVLDDLRDGGRMVGIVSHVADLRQRIPTQLRVTKGRCGSTIAGGDPSAGLPVTK